MPTTHHYDLWIDESGTFQETSAKRSERRAAQRQHFPSQLAGLLVPQGLLDRKRATAILHSAHSTAGLPYARGQQVHAHKIHDQTAYNALAGTVADSVARKPGWYAARMVNAEQVAFGDRVTTYTMMLSELMLRIYEELGRNHNGPIHLHATCAIVVLGHHQDDSPVFMDEEAYRSCLRRELTRAAIARGLAAESSRWHFSLRLGSGLRRPELQLCDIISNSSKGDFDRCTDDTRTKLLNAFGPFDLSLTIRTLDRRVDELMDAGSLGPALQLLGSALVEDELGPAARTGAEQRLQHLLERLARQPAPTRDMHLAILGPWLDQLIEVQRDADQGIAMARWAIKQILEPLEGLVDERAQPTLRAHTYDVHRRLLSAANHSGCLHIAREQSSQLNELAPALAGHWEHAPILVEGMLAQAVHLGDCLDHDGASALMRTLDDYYEALADLMHDALPTVFPEQVRSEQRAKALGTWLQAEMMAAVRQPERFDTARGLNDRAIAEFLAPGDIARQQQYRGHLETLAGNWSHARQALALGLGAPEARHHDLARAVANLDGVPHAFALLHWLRLGAAIHTRGPVGERESFDKAFRSVAPWRSSWVTDPRRGYPAHGIRRSCAVILAGQGKLDRAESVLGHLRALTPLERGQPLLALIVLAAHVEVAALAWNRNERQGRRLLEHPEWGASRQLNVLMKSLEGLDIPLNSELEAWPDTIGQVLMGQIDTAAIRTRLLELTAPLAW